MGCCKAEEGIAWQEEDHLWIGPLQVTEVLENNTYQLATTDEEEVGTPVNGRFLKKFSVY